MSEETLYTAMAKAFPLIEGALKDSNNPHFKSKYADLSSVVSAIKPALSDNGLFFTQMTHEQSGGVCVETHVHHHTGQSMSFGKLFVPAGKNDAQGYGSALTYARRYSLMTAFGVCPEDDDGNAASANPKDAPVFVTKEQAKEIANLIKEYKVDEKAFLVWVKAESTAHILATHYDKVMATLADKKPKTINEELGDEVPYQ